jgi:hypothetical protein
MIKINIEYTIIGPSIFKVNPVVAKDDTSTVIETILSESIKILAEEAVKTQKENSDIKNILGNIGKQA